MEHPNQKLANEVADILRSAADSWLYHPKEIGMSGREYYSCNAVFHCADYDFNWSATKVERVIMRFLRSLGVDTESFHALDPTWKNCKRQETRHTWLHLAAQVAEDCPDLVPTYGKKVKNVLS